MNDFIVTAFATVALIGAGCLVAGFLCWIADSRWWQRIVTRLWL